MGRVGVRGDREVSFLPGELCAQVDGFSLHARVRISLRDRERLERLCRYVARPAVASERLSLSRNGNVLYRLRRPWRDGTTHFVFEPLVFLERLAALVPRPRTHLVTYHAGRRYRSLPPRPGETASSLGHDPYAVPDVDAARPAIESTLGRNFSSECSQSTFCAVPIVERDA